jgi:C1A family cysteine protease
MKATLLSPILLAVFAFASVSGAESIVNVQKLNQKLEKANAGWIAKDNWLNRLSKAEAKRMMGLKDTPSADVDFAVPEKLTKDTLPMTLDWRNKDGKNWVSPILNQGNCGSCVAFASIGVMETQLNISSILPNLNTRLSAQNLFACGGGSCSYGWFPQSAASYLMKKGVTDEACMPYISGATGEDVACSAHCADSEQRTVRIGNYSTPSLTVMDVDSVKRALQSGPVVTTLSVYADFITYAGGVYKHASGDMLGGHAVSIVGYDDSTQSYIIRNSWGEDWGEQGFGHVAYSDVSGVGRSTWSFDIPTATGAVSVLNPRDYSYVSASFDFNGISSFSGTDSLSYSVYDKDNKAVWSGVCQGAECSAKFDSTKFADGRYEIQARANNPHGDSLGMSSRQFFYVVNQAPSLQLSFAGKNVDLSQPVKDRIEFSVTAQSSSVPMSSLEFHFKDAAGKETSRKAEVVLNQMTLGWRTPAVPNGAYDVWMVGRVKSNTTDTVVQSAHTTITVQN